VKSSEVLVLPFLIFVLRLFSSKYWSVMRMVGKPFNEMTHVENRNDDECRVLARTFIRDIRRSATMSPADHRRLFAAFHATRDHVC
jgi:hypothetical protein